MTQEARAYRYSRPGNWAGYAAATWAFVFAVPSFYWGIGGTFGADTVARQAAEYNWATDPLIMTTVVVTGLLKVFGGLVALALVRPAWPRPRRWMMLTGGWTGAFLLVAYGGINAIAQALVVARVIPAPAGADWYALRWHLYLWSPYFVVWGILLGLAVRHYQRVAPPAAGSAVRGHADPTS
jgi:Protein of unknown function (DUF3995)